MGQVFTIPPHVPFLQALAHGLLAHGDALPDVTVLVPTRRAARALAEALLEASDADAVLLPVIRPLGDVDEEFPAQAASTTDGNDALTLPAAIAPMHRTLALARLIMARAHATGLGPENAAQAIALADELAALLDAFATEEVSLDQLPGVVHDDFAGHWKETLAFLEVITDAWPKMLSDLGLVEAARRRRMLIDATCVRWQANPPGPVIAAGSTGSIPATARLLAQIAAQQDGAVVLPGLDQRLDDASWAACGPAHPQFGMRQLLERMGVDRSDVQIWPHTDTCTHTRKEASARTRLVSEALRPAETTDKWRDAGATLGPQMDDALAGLTMLTADTPQLESLSIALAMRETLETPGRTAALVTPDRALARRVAGDLARWGIAVDDSGGQPLMHSLPGSFLLLTAQMLAENLAPVPMLAALKHRLAQGGEGPGVFHRRIGFLDKHVLRGPRPAPGLDGLDSAITALTNPDLRHGGLKGARLETARKAAGTLRTLIGPAAELFARDEADAAELATAHLQAVEALAATHKTTGAHAMWSDVAGEAAASLMADVLTHADLLGTLSCADYPSILGALMAGRMVRPVRRSHSRLQILGPLEARLQHADRLIMGGLNEGVWPARAETGAWLNRPMRIQLGLEVPERQIGLAAHDVAQGLGSEDIILTRAERAEGQPTVPSRWWLRIENLTRGLDHAIDSGPWLEVARTLDRPQREALQAPRPAPKPPVAARPSRLSVTRINDLFRDPYSIYAESVLGLSPLDDLDAFAGAADRGNLIHTILETFSEQNPGPMPADGYQRLLAIAREAFDAAATRPAVRAIWYPRFLRVAEWFIPWETERRTRIARTHVEMKGKYVFPVGTRTFTLSGIADRIDVLSDGTLAILDYKTGVVPTVKQTNAKFSVQLPLEAEMARAGTFGKKDFVLPAADTSELAYVELRGGREPGAIKPLDDPMGLAASIMEHTLALLETFEKEETPYLSQPRPQFLAAFSNYNHLARVKEWQTASDPD
ncbi:double-strand break repair protein AddB [Pyruvatibacter sp.]|uniref:double-strand break repair protein AddB n=1 Tax=Pyruvatibacter sp. TaxID=1981328 RepID=UPI0032ED00F0